MQWRGVVSSCPAAVLRCKCRASCTSPVSFLISTLPKLGASRAHKAEKVTGTGHRTHEERNSYHGHLEDVKDII